MAVNLISSNDINITQSGSDISLNFTPNAVTNKNVYSTTETRIGTWDGSPLYRKMIKGTLVSGDLTVDISSLNASKIVNCYGRAGNAGEYRPLNFYYEGYYVSVRGNGTSILIASSSAYAGEPFEMVVEYTKTTD